MTEAAGPLRGEGDHEEVDVWKEDGSRVEKVSEMFEGGEAVVDV